MSKLIGEQLKEWFLESGMKKVALAEKAGMTRSALDRVLDGKTEKSRKLRDILVALGKTEAELFGDDPVAPLFDRYTLNDAPVCTSPYHLALESADILQLPALPPTPIICLAVPWGLEAEENAIRAVYRMKGHTRAMIVEVLEVGDDHHLQAVGIQQSEFLLDGVQGQILAAIYDLVSAESLFRR